MNLAIVHYHLNRGGVTRVIANQLLSLDRAVGDGGCRAALLYGGRCHGWPADLAARLERIELDQVAVPGLDYDDETRAGIDPRSLAAKLREAFGQLRFAPGDTVVHAHNHTLGKNLSLPGALVQLADDGYALLLQVHDFAEDFRAANYARLPAAFGPAGTNRGQWFPEASHVHYALLNQRDLAIMRSSGLEADRIHSLPNPVPPIDDLPPQPAARDVLASRFGIRRDARFVLYPVRGIRRKNVGELLLWAALADPGVELAITLPPLNPRERPYYESWRAIAGELKLPCWFDVGAEGGATFAENLAAADVIISTSVAEGFGMVFLEAWLAGRPLIGRDLPEITSDFADAGVRLDALHDRFGVPVAWVGADRIRSSIATGYAAALAAYGRPPLDSATLDARLDEKFAAGLVDFADLDEPMQEQVIRRVAADAHARDRLLAAHPWVHESLAGTCFNAEIIAQNAAAVERSYSLDSSGARLDALYRTVAASPRGAIAASQHVSASLLDQFLDLSRFRLIRS